ncbi:MAG: Flp pilus assembly protein CpaB [Rhodospirillales bacterium]
MKVLIVGIIVLALAVAGVSTYLIQTFSGEENIEELQKEAQKPKIRVLVAAQDLRPGDAVKPEALAWQVWIEEGLNSQYVVVDNDEQEAERIKEFTGGIVRRVITKGEPILPAKIFKSDKNRFMAGVLKSGMRAVTFSVSAATASGGFVLPGDRIDVLLTHGKASEALRKKEQGKTKDPDAPLTVLSQTTETIMRDVLVLAVDQLVDVAEGTAVPARNITLELTPKQAELLITARTMGKISLVLRSLAREEGESTGPSFTTDVEVSPFLTNINAILEAQRDKRTKALQDKLKELQSEKKQLQQETRKGSGAPAPARKKKTVIKIYKGKAKALEEVTVK